VLDVVGALGVELVVKAKVLGHLDKALTSSGREAERVRFASPIKPTTATRLPTRTKAANSMLAAEPNQQRRGWCNCAPARKIHNCAAPFVIPGPRSLHTSCCVRKTSILQGLLTLFFLSLKRGTGQGHT
jgi:hypothetical protein